MYEQISANKRRSFFIIFFFVVAVIGLGFVIDRFVRLGWIALAIAVVFALVGALTSYYNSDKIALAVAKARPADPAQYARLNNLVESMAIAAGIPKPRVYVVDDPAPNAFATGRDPEHSAIAVTTGLLEIMNRVELEGVIAHEMSHIRNYDIRVSTIAVVCVGVLVIASDIAIRMLWFGGEDRDRAGGNPIIAVVGIILIILAPIFAQLMQLALSRRRESLADVSAVELTRYPPGLISALEKLRDNNAVVRAHSNAIAHLWIEEPSDTSRKGFAGKLNRLFSTHPPIDERIQALRELA